MRTPTWELPDATEALMKAADRVQEKARRFAEWTRARPYDVERVREVGEALRREVEEAGDCMNAWIAAAERAKAALEEVRTP